MVQALNPDFCAQTLIFMLLSLETATAVCSVSLLTPEGEALAAQHLYTDRPHADRLTLVIQELLRHVGTTSGQLTAVVLSEGPGSYTGLRIGASVAKGMCYALDIPLVPVPTLKAMAAAAKAGLPEETTKARFVPLLDARRMEVYTAVFSPELEEETPVQAQVMEAGAFDKVLEAGTTFFFGDGMEKSRALLQHPNARFLPAFRPDAVALGQLGAQALQAGTRADLAYFEPFYLKAFQAVKAKKNKSLV